MSTTLNRTSSQNSSNNFHDFGRDDFEQGFQKTSVFVHHYLLVLDGDACNAQRVDEWTCRDMAGIFSHVACLTISAYSPVTLPAVSVYAPNCPELSDFECWMSLINAGPSLEEFSPEAIQDMVIDQVVASQRLEGIEVEPDTLRKILHGKLRT